MSHRYDDTRIGRLNDTLSLHYPIRHPPCCWMHWPVRIFYHLKFIFIKIDSSCLHAYKPPCFSSRMTWTTFLSPQSVALRSTIDDDSEDTKHTLSTPCFNVFPWHPHPPHCTPHRFETRMSAWPTFVLSYVEASVNCCPPASTWLIRLSPTTVTTAF